ncbi:MAG: ABC transporter substrate-binding protein, partial [Myxococcota bacterium]
MNALRVIPRRMLASGLILLALTGCLREDERYFGNVVPKHPANELWTNMGSEPEYYDPGKCSENSGGQLAWNLFAGLVQVHPKTLEPMPDMAESWELNEDGDVYTFQLRSAQWSDGHPLTAADFEWSWRRVLDPETASKYASFLFTLKNGRAFNQRAIWVHGLPSLAEQPTPDDFQAESALEAGAATASASPDSAAMRARSDATLLEELKNTLGEIP